MQRFSRTCAQAAALVPIKTDDELDLQAMHGVRDRLVARRTSVINQLRAFLLERGMVFAKTPCKLKQAMPEILENVSASRWRIAGNDAYYKTPALFLGVMAIFWFGYIWVADYGDGVHMGRIRRLQTGKEVPWSSSLLTPSTRRE